MVPPNRMYVWFQNFKNLNNHTITNLMKNGSSDRRRLELDPLWQNYVHACIDYSIGHFSLSGSLRLHFTWERAPVCIVFLGRFSVVQKPSAYQDITSVQVWRICISSRYCSFEELWYTRTGVFDTHCFQHVNMLTSWFGETLNYQVNSKLLHFQWKLSRLQIRSPYNQHPTQISNIYIITYIDHIFVYIHIT